MALLPTDGFATIYLVEWSEPGKNVWQDVYGSRPTGKLPRTSRCTKAIMPFLHDGDCYRQYRICGALTEKEAERFASITHEFNPDIDIRITKLNISQLRTSVRYASGKKTKAA